MKVKYLIFFLEKLVQFIPFFAFLIFLPSSLKNGIIIIDQTWGYHTTCLTPALEEVPRGAWYCPTCAGVGVGTSGPTMDIAVEENRPFPPIQRPRRYTIPRYLFWFFRVWSFWECNVFWVFPVLRVCEWTSVSRCWDLILFKFYELKKRREEEKNLSDFILSLFVLDVSAWLPLVAAATLSLAPVNLSGSGAPSTTPGSSWSGE